MTAEREKLTVAACRDLPPGRKLKCHVVQGLELEAGATVKTWRLYYRNSASVQRRPKIGYFPALSIEQAREIAKEWLAEVARGGDPSAKRQEYRASPTVADLIAHYLKEHVAARNSAKHAEGVQSQIRKHILPGLGHLKVADVTAMDVNALLRKVAAGAPVQANRVRATLSKMFQLAESDSLRWRPKYSNPCRDEIIVRQVERARRRKITGAEWVALHAALEALRADYVRQVTAIYCNLYAGSRVSEILTARWDDLRIDADGARLELVEHKTASTGDVRTVWLSRQAVQLIRSMPVHFNGYLFGELADLKKPYFAVHDVWEMACKRAGIEGLQMRDLRRTFASVVKRIGGNLDLAGDLLGHRSPQTTAIYAHIYSDVAGDAAQKVSDEIDRLMLPGQKS